MHLLAVKIQPLAEVAAITVTTMAETEITDQMADAIMASETEPFL